MDWVTLALSFRLALVTTTVLLVVGVPLAWWLATSPRRWKVIVEALVAMPLVLPPTVLGFYLLVALGPQSPVGRAWMTATGSTLPFTFAGLVVGSVIYSLPFAVQPFAAAFARVERPLVEAAWTLGASRWRTFTRVVLPLSRSGIAAGLVLSFVHTLGEFGVVLMIGGNLRGRTRTVSVAIYDDVQALDYASAHRTALVLAALSFVVLIVTSMLQRGRQRAWPSSW